MLNWFKSSLFPKTRAFPKAQPWEGAVRKYGGPGEKLRLEVQLRLSEEDSSLFTYVLCVCAEVTGSNSFGRRGTVLGIVHEEPLSYTSRSGEAVDCPTLDRLAQEKAREMKCMFPRTIFLLKTVMESVFYRWLPVGPKEIVCE